MSDFDERLSAVLTAEAEHAPPVAGLAREARRRHVVRRRRRIAVGTVAAALVVAVPVALLTGGGGDDADVATDPPPAGEWRTVTQDDVRAEVPGDWTKHTCDFDGFTADIYGPSAAEACDFDEYLAFYGSANFDTATYPGEISEGDDGIGGYVYAGDYAVSVSTSDRELTRRILASARVEGQPQVEADLWERSFIGGRTYLAPAAWGVEAESSDGYLVEVVAGFYVGGERAEQIDESHYQRQDARLRVVGPTQAVVDLVWESVTRTPDTTE